MYSIIVFTQEEFENRFKELEENYGITRKMFFDSINFPNNFNTEKLNPKYLEVGTYTKILEALFDAEKNPEKYKIFTENSSNIIENHEPENAEMSFIDSIIAGIPSVEIEENETENNTKIFEKILQAEGKKPLNPKTIKMEVEDFKFFTGTFGQENTTETSEESIEEKEEIITEKEEWEKVSEEILVEDFLPPKLNIYIPIKTEDIEVLQKFSKQIILMEDKITRWKPSKYSLASIRDEYNFFVKKLEKKYYQNLSEYYILKNIYDDITMKYYFPDSAGTRKIINLLTGKLISQKNLQELNPNHSYWLVNPLHPQIVEPITFDHTSEWKIKIKKEKQDNCIFEQTKSINTHNSQEFISPRTGKKIIIKQKVEPKKKQKEVIIWEPRDYFSYIKECAEMLKYNIENYNIKEVPLSIIETFHARLKEIETETRQDLNEYYIKKDHTNLLTGEQVYSNPRDIMSKIYTCAWHIYVNKI